MTTSPVVTITDELVAELKKEAWLCDSDTSMFMDTAVVAALLAERAELKLRAAQGDWLIEYMASEREDLDDTLMEGCSDNQPHALRSIIDATMQAAQ